MLVIIFAYIIHTIMAKSTIQHIKKYEGSFVLLRVKSDINIKLIKFQVQGRKMRAKNT